MCLGLHHILLLRYTRPLNCIYVVASSVWLPYYTSEKTCRRKVLRYKSQESVTGRQVRNVDVSTKRLRKRLPIYSQNAWEPGTQSRSPKGEMGDSSIWVITCCLPGDFISRKHECSQEISSSTLGFRCPKWCLAQCSLCILLKLKIERNERSTFIFYK